MCLNLAPNPTYNFQKFSGEALIPSSYIKNPDFGFFVVPLGGERHTKGLEEDLEKVRGESPPINTGHYDHVTINRHEPHPLS